MLPAAKSRHVFGLSEQRAIFGQPIQADLAGDFDGDGSNSRLLGFLVRRHGKNGSEPIANYSR